MDGVSVAKIAKKMELKNFTEEIELKEKPYGKKFFGMYYQKMFAII